MSTLETTIEVAADVITGGASGKEPSSFFELAQFALIALIIVIPIRLFVAQPFIVSGESMENTLHTNEFLIIDEISYRFNDPQRGDVIVFHYPKDPSKYFIKRIIGLPGETIDIQGNVVTITKKDASEVTLEEPYIKTMARNTSLTETLGDREYFVMGDNRDASSDSRVWGVLNREKIVGRALLRLFPFSEMDVFPGKYDLTSV
jgi:signal peptidase I